MTVIMLRSGRLLSLRNSVRWYHTWGVTLPVTGSLLIASTTGVMGLVVMVDHLRPTHREAYLLDTSLELPGVTWG